MADLKAKGDLAELMIAADLRRQGYRILFPYGEDAPYDLVIEREDGRFERVQVKHLRSDGEALVVRCYTQTIVAGKVLAKTQYTAAIVDWVAGWDATSGACCYVPAAELGAGRNTITLRLVPARNNQSVGVRMAAEFATLR